VSGITFHDNALLAAQILGLHIFNNEFRYRGATRGERSESVNQIRDAEFDDNSVTTQTESLLTCSAPQTARMFTATRSMDLLAPERGSQMNVHDNTITCVNSSANCCVRFGITRGNTVSHNHVIHWGKQLTVSRTYRAQSSARNAYQWQLDRNRKQSQAINVSRRVIVLDVMVTIAP
jgi:hypothetical protein